MNANLKPGFEERIDEAERRMLEADTRADREVHCRAFLQAIAERNEARSQEQVEQLERERGLR